MAKKSVCKLCGHEVDGEKRFCGLCGGEMNIVEVPDVTPVDFSNDPGGFGNENTNNTTVFPNNQNTYTNINNNSDKQKTAATAGMVIGIVSAALCCVPYLSVAAGIVGLILSVFGMKLPSAKGMAIAGLVCSIIGIIIGVIWTIYWSICGCAVCTAYNSISRW